MPDKESDRGKEAGPLFLNKKTPRETKVSISDIAELRKIFEDSKLAKWVILAGVGGLVEALRLGYDILEYVHRKGF